MNMPPRVRSCVVDIGNDCARNSL